MPSKLAKYMVKGGSCQLKLGNGLVGLIGFQESEKVDEVGLGVSLETDILCVVALKLRK